MLFRAVCSTLRCTSYINGRAVSQGARLYHDDHFKPPHMNELPVPEGSWEEANRKRQQKYNIQLLAGLGFTVFSIVVAKSSGLFFFNYSRPERPADITKYEVLG